MGRSGLGVFENDHAADLVVELHGVLEPEIHGFMANGLRRARGDSDSLTSARGRFFATTVDRNLGRLAGQALRAHAGVDGSIGPHRCAAELVAGAVRAIVRRAGSARAPLAVVRFHASPARTFAGTRLRIVRVGTAHRSRGMLAVAFDSISARDSARLALAFRVRRLAGVSACARRVGGDRGGLLRLHTFLWLGLARRRRRTAPLRAREQSDRSDQHGRSQHRATRVSHATRGRAHRSVGGVGEAIVR